MQIMPKVITLIGVGVGVAFPEKIMQIMPKVGT